MAATAWRRVAGRQRGGQVAGELARRRQRTRRRHRVRQRQRIDGGSGRAVSSPGPPPSAELVLRVAADRRTDSSLLVASATKAEAGGGGEQAVQHDSGRAAGRDRDRRDRRRAATEVASRGYASCWRRLGSQVPGCRQRGGGVNDAEADLLVPASSWPRARHRGAGDGRDDLRVGQGRVLGLDEGDDSCCQRAGRDSCR